MNPEKSRNFGPPDPIFLEKLPSEKSAGDIVPPATIGLTNVDLSV